jgi:hypothetical protein
MNHINSAHISIISQLSIGQPVAVEIEVYHMVSVKWKNIAYYIVEKPLG